MPADPRAKFAIVADASDYNRKLKSARRNTDSFAQSIRSSLKVGAAAGAAAVTAAAIGLTRLASEAAKSADALAKQADILGISTQKLAAYQHAARLSGSSNEGLEKGMRKLQKSIVDATNGMSTYTRAFDALKLDPAELKQMAPDQQFEALGKAFAGVKDQAEKVAIAYDLFGGRNTTLLNTLVLTGEQLNKIEEDTKRWGTALTRVDARKIEAANDAVERSKSALEGLGTNIAVAVAPFKQDVANAFADAAAESNGFRDEIQATMEALVVGANFAMNAVRGIQLTIQGAKLAALSVQEALAEKASGFAIVGGGFIETGESARKFNEAGQANLRREIAKTKAAIKVLVDEFQSGEEALTEFRLRQEEALAAARNSLNADGDGESDDDSDSRFKLFGDREREQLEAKVEAIRQSLLTENELIRQAQEDREAILQESRELGLVTQAEHNELVIETARQTADRLLEIERRRIAEQEKLERRHQQVLINSRATSGRQLLALARSLGQRSKTIARAAFIAEKAVAVARIIVNTNGAAARALAELGPIAGPPLAAKIKASGYTLAALTAAIGISEAASFGRSASPGISGAADPQLGAPTNPIFANGASAAGSGSADQRPQTVVNFNVYGDVNGQNGYTVIDEIRQIVEETDAVIFSPTSRQALDLLSD